MIQNQLISRTRDGQDKEKRPKPHLGPIGNNWMTNVHSYSQRLHTHDTENRADLQSSTDKLAVRFIQTVVGQVEVGEARMVADRPEHNKTTVSKA